MTRLHVLVVDDEPLARRAVRKALQGRPEVARVTECADGVAAVECIHLGGIDLVFLDVRMPEVDGFEVVRRIGAEDMPPVVFLTAHEEFAVSAFEVRALDYLLKPFTPARFDESFQRGLQALRARDSGEQTAGLPEAASERSGECLRIKIAGRTTLVNLVDIVWIEAANTYVRVHTRDKTHLLRASIGALESRLDPRRFLRVHRSAIVQLGAIRELRHVLRGDYELLLSSGETVRASRRRRAELIERLGDRIL